MVRVSSHPRLALFLGAVLALALGIAVLGGTLWFLGTNEPLLKSWLDWDAVPEELGLTEADRKPIAQLVADTMAGREKVFQYKGLFSHQAETHMADCAPLFGLARTVGLVGFGVFLAALGGCFFCRAWRECAIGMLIGVGLLLLIVLVLGVWGLIDFDSLFTAFHKTFFTNDDWLFPADDLLITLMPITFFIRYAAVGCGLWLACLIATAAVAGLILRKTSSALRAPSPKGEG
ncbi:MAG: DUF1461 domain-containing protein [Clostridia bacterium]|nr:DUF1461 domain-containing protein [Clostridia bacterium]